MKLENNKQFFKIIDGKNIVIYGDGFVARNFLEALRLNNLDNKVICFTKTAVNDCTEVDGVKVQSLQYVKSISNSVVCIAVHESNKDEIIKNLEENKIYNYIWIYPVFHSLMIGNQIEKNTEIPVKKIISQNMNDYSIATRYLAIDNYYGKNTVGYDIYVKLMMLHCSQETARKRLINFIRLIENWNQNGYDNTKNITILQNYSIIDGIHRCTLGVYNGLESMVCNIYPTSLYTNDYRIMKREARMDKNIIREKIREKYIICLLDKTVDKILDKYN